jgi:NAD(P)H-binding
VRSAHEVADNHLCSPNVVAVWAFRGHRMRDKETMEELIRDPDIDATLVRLPALTDGPRTGRYRTGPRVPIPITGSIRRADVANLLPGAAVTGPGSCSSMVISSPLAGTRAVRRALVRSISAISPATLRSEFDVKVPARELM